MNDIKELRIRIHNKVLRRLKLMSVKQDTSLQRLVSKIIEEFLSK